MVPLNGAFGRLLCKFSACLLVLTFLIWTFSQRQQSAIEVDNLEARLQFAQEQLSSLHAQLDVIAKHKEKIEQLTNDERDQNRLITNKQAARIAQLEAENARLGLALTDLNQTNGKPCFIPTVATEKQHGNEIVPQDSPQHQQPVEPPLEEDEDPFGQKKADEGEEVKVGNGAGQIKAPNLAPKEEEEVEEEKEKNEAEEEDRQREAAAKKKEPNGGEKNAEEEDYVFRRPRPREALIFQRAQNGTGPTFPTLLPGRELMRKLADKKRAEEEEKKKKAAESGMIALGPAEFGEEGRQQQQDGDFRK